MVGLWFMHDNQQTTIAALSSNRVLLCHVCISGDKLLWNEFRFVPNLNGANRVAVFRFRFQSAPCALPFGVCLRLLCVHTSARLHENDQRSDEIRSLARFPPILIVGCLVRITIDDILHRFVARLNSCNFYGTVRGARACFVVVYFFSASSPFSQPWIRMV